MSIPEYAQPRDPSLALCQICANRDHTTLAEGNDGAFHRYNTCLLWVEGKCNDFIPAYTGGWKL